MTLFQESPIVCDYTDCTRTEETYGAAVANGWHLDAYAEEAVCPEHWETWCEDACSICFLQLDNCTCWICKHEVFHGTGELCDCEGDDDSD